MRAFWVWLHRYVGLAIAAFVTVAGLTGSVLAYIGPLQKALVPDPYIATTAGTPLGLDDLDARIDAFDRSARVTQWPLAMAPQMAAAVSVAGAVDRSTGKPARLDYDTIYLDPVSGAVLGTTRGNEQSPVAGKVLDFIYSLHYKLALPGQWGIWIMGVAAILWFVDCFVGAWLTLPRGRPLLAKWKPAWGVKRRRLNFDLHRAGGLWLWGMLAILALSSVEQNLYQEVMRPVTGFFLPLAADPFADRAVRHPAVPPAAQIGPSMAAALAKADALRRNWQSRPERMQRDDARGLYRVVFTTPKSEWLTATRRELYLDDRTGRVLKAFEPGHGEVGDSVLDWLAALHFGNVFGWPYKLLLCISGVGIALLSVTGLIIWWRKRRARLSRRRKVSIAQTGVGSVS